MQRKSLTETQHKCSACAQALDTLFEDVQQILHAGDVAHRSNSPDGVSSA